MASVAVFSSSVTSSSKSPAICCSSKLGARAVDRPYLSHLGHHLRLHGVYRAMVFYTLRFLLGVAEARFFPGMCFT